MKAVHQISIHHHVIPSPLMSSLLHSQGPPPLLPNNAAITVASLQATSSLLQQALAMASAQVAANSTAQQQVCKYNMSPDLLTVSIPQQNIQSCIEYI